MTQRLDGLNQVAIAPHEQNLQHDGSSNNAGPKTYQGILCDVWGVLHNGERVYPAAAVALANFRKAGGSVVMITNSPRPSAGVLSQFADLGVPEDAYDAVVTSGDVTRDLIKKVSGGVFLLGPERDLPLFDGLNTDLVSADKASAVVCTGLFEDETETPDDYHEMLSDFARRELPFICANPDIVVERGNRLIWCAGALAKAYGELGGPTQLAGKPHPPIYSLAWQTINQVAKRDLQKGELLAIGDGMPTDVAGGLAFGADVLYISGGIHAAEYGGADTPDEAQLEVFLKTRNVDPALWMPRLVW